MLTIDDLKAQNLILFEVISGSRAFGLATPTSDTDIKGVFYLPKEQFYGLDYIEQINNETNDIVYYELGRFVELLIRNNPNILEVLATPEDCVLYKHPLMDNLPLSLFLSQLTQETFGNYAAGQIKKARGLNKKIVNPMDVKEKELLDFCSVVEGYQTVPLKSWLEQRSWRQEQCGLINIPHSKGLYALFYDESAQAGYQGLVGNKHDSQLRVSSIEEHATMQAYISCNFDGYASYLKEYKSYQQWLKERNEERYQQNQQNGALYDAKNMMHTIRLLQSAERIIRTGSLTVRCPNRDELLAIKQGQKSYEELLEMADELINRINQAKEHCPLPTQPDKAEILNRLVAMRSALYQ